MKYRIQNRETGAYIVEFPTLAEAEAELKAFEEYDKAEDIYTPDFYEIVGIPEAYPLEDAKKLIDDLIDELKTERILNTTPTTKMINYLYLKGKIEMLKELSGVGGKVPQSGLSPLVELYNYRQTELDDLTAYFNHLYINPICTVIKLFHKAQEEYESEYESYKERNLK